MLVITLKKSSIKFSLQNFLNPTNRGKLRLETVLNIDREKMNIWNITLFWSSKCCALIDGIKSRKMSVVNQFWQPFYYRVHVIPNPIRHTSVPFQNLKRSLRTTKKVNFTFRWVFCAIRNTKIFERIVLFLNNNRMYFCKKKNCRKCQMWKLSMNGFWILLLGELASIPMGTRENSIYSKRLTGTIPKYRISNR